MIVDVEFMFDLMFSLLPMLAMDAVTTTAAVAAISCMYKYLKIFFDFTGATSIADAYIAITFYLQLIIIHFEYFFSCKQFAHLLHSSFPLLFADGVAIVC